ncbi:MAG: GNAT family N-acetyltransferase [Leptospiraceae bacterium]|nr:GNAT family N-acetyltransferase [Leptospiraceae bacterium]
MNEIKIIHANIKYAKSYCNAVDIVAKELKYLASTTGFPEETTIQFVEMIEKNNLSQYYAISNDIVIGWCDILPKSFEGLNHVGNLGMGIIPKFRKNGIGSLLIEKSLEHARDINKLEKIELELFKSNTSALHFYQKYGFQKEGERIRSRKLNGVYDNMILMGLFL